MSEPPRLLDRVRDAVRVRQYSRRTEEAYVGWIRRYILFHKKRHPSAMGAIEVNAFLTHLAVSENVAASTQAQARSALLFLYEIVLDSPLPWLDDVVRAQTAQVAGRSDQGRSARRTWRENDDDLHVLNQAGGRGVRSPLETL
jgi:hypothetical protein